MMGEKGSVNLGYYRDLVETVLRDMERHRVRERIWQRDYTLWKPDPKEIDNRLGWLSSPGEMREKLEEINAFVNDVRSEGYTCALLLGMGGSSLAPEVFRKSFGVRNGYLDLAVLDSTDPGAVLTHAGQIDMQRTLFIVSTKSGTTVETLSFMKYFYNKAGELLNVREAGKHFIAITDPGSPLADIAEMYRFRKTFLNDPNIGGRYSALSYFGLVPAALVGIDLTVFLDRAVKVSEWECSPRSSHDDGIYGLFLGAVMGILAKAGRDKLTFVFSPEIESFGNWLEQLIAESTGKEGKGIVPIVGETLGSPQVYGNDRFFVWISREGDEGEKEKITAIEKAGFPLIKILLKDVYDLAGQCFLWEMATAVAGHLLGVNPFDQPDVEAAKELAKKAIAQYRAQGMFPEETPVLAQEGIMVYGDVEAQSLSEALTTFMARRKPGSYVALHAFVQPSSDTGALLQNLRMRLRDRYHLATTLGYGPRFLHSTGQLFKGDGGRGLFVQFTADDPCDVPIPDEIGLSDSSISFGILKNAQAAGDRQALINAGRPVLRFHLGSDVCGGLKVLTEFL